MFRVTGLLTRERKQEAGVLIVLKAIAPNAPSDVFMARVSRSQTRREHFSSRPAKFCEFVMFLSNVHLRNAGALREPLGRWKNYSCETRNHRI